MNRVFICPRLLMLPRGQRGVCRGMTYAPDVHHHPASCPYIPHAQGLWRGQRQSPGVTLHPGSCPGILRPESPGQR